MNWARITAMILLFLGAVGSLLYGAIFHTVAVEEEKEREISIMIPTLSGPGESPLERGEDARAMPPGEVDPFRTPPARGAQQENSENPFENHSTPLVPPGMRTEKVTEKYVESSDEPEWAIIREVTIGGVVRLANGALKRTYSGQPPALCPS
jgi:hypothetical protein